MNRCTEQEVTYFKEILADHLQTNYPDVAMPETQLEKRAKEAAQLYHRDDLTTNEVIERQFDILMDGYREDADCADQLSDTSAN